MENIRISIYCIVEDGGKVILTEDEGKPGWKLPGGKVENKEMLLDAARREVKEELGLEVEVKEFVGIQEYIKEDGEHRLRFYTVANLIGNKDIKLMPGEVKLARWFSLDELKNLKQEDFFKEVYYLAVKSYLSGNRQPVGNFLTTVLKK